MKQGVVKENSRRAAKKGARYLDEMFQGDKWALLVHPRSFDIERGNRCVLGQIFDVAAGAARDVNGYSWFSDNINGVVEEMGWFAFVDRYGFDVTGGSTTFAGLQSAWLKEINARRKNYSPKYIRVFQHLWAKSWAEAS